MQNYINSNDSIDIDELLAKSKSDSEEIVSKEETEGLIISDNVTLAENTVKEYNGPGAIIEREDYENGQNQTKGSGINLDGVKADTYEKTKEYMSQMDEKIEKQKQITAKLKAEGIIPQDANPEEMPVGAANPKKDVSPKKEEAKSPEEVVNIFIDRAQVGELVFTPEQQKKLDFASKIKVVETTESKFKSIKIRRDKVSKGSPNKEDKLSIINKAFDRTLSPFIAIGSGYLGKMGNCSVADIMQLGRHIDSGKNLTSELERWQLLYNKMKYCSIGLFKSFDDFLKNTAYDDYENLQFALICASFPEKTTLDFTCPKCKTKFSKTFANKEMLITNNVDEVMQNAVEDIVKADTFIERAKEVHENALFNTVTRIAVNEEDDSILLDLYVPSAYDAIYRTYKDLTDEHKDEETYEAYVQMLKYIRAAYIAVDIVDNEYEYTEFTEPDHILKIISRFSETQLNKIGVYLSESYLSHRYTYGVKDIVCTNPKCHENLGDFPITMDNLLFLKVRPQ